MIHHFTPYSRQQACLIMKRIIERPCAKPFVFPIDPITSGYHDYYDQIQNPITLIQIMTKIESYDGYSNCEMWRSDMLLVYNNAITYFGKDSLMGKLAQCFLEYFEKQFSSFSNLFDSSIWLKSYLKLSQKQKQLESQMPGTLGTIFKTLTKSKSIIQSNAMNEPNIMKDVEIQTETPPKRKRGRPRLNKTKSSAFIIKDQKPNFIVPVNHAKSPDVPLLKKAKFPLPILNRSDESSHRIWSIQNEDDDALFLDETDEYDKYMGSSL